jgi:hypothetical protein
VKRGVWRRSIDSDLFPQANLELEDLEFIVSSSDALTIQSFKRHLEEIVSGHVSPHEERKSRPRDFQFELLIASTLKSNGISARLEEPDVVFDVNGTSFSIAAKRPKSTQKLGTNLRKAEKQLVAKGLDGLIALDLSAILNPQNNALRVGTFAAARQFVETWLGNFVRVNRDQIVADARPLAALGVFLYVAIMVEDLSVPRLGTIRHSVLFPFDPLREVKLKPLFALLSRSTAMARNSEIQKPLIG